MLGRHAARPANIFQAFEKIFNNISQKSQYLFVKKISNLLKFSVSASYQGELR
jgi:hypothetical protein